MARTVAIGIQNYDELIEKNLFYIDKTAFIKEWWESGDSVTLITRPRRFGKTLNMSMTEQFFSLKYAGRSDLFEGKKVWEDEQLRVLQGTWPVISLSFANIKETKYETAVYRICQLLKQLYEQHSFFRNSEKLSDSEKKFFVRLCEDMNETDAPMAIYSLCDFLSRYYGKKVIILLDEYDTPMQEAYVHGYWEELVSFTRSLFNATFKTNPWLERAIMTGITRVSKESIFSDLNHLKVVTTTSDEYADCFGFTEKEVFAAMDEFGYTEKELAITNAEVYLMFQNMIRDWFAEAEVEYNDFVRAMLGNDTDAMNEYMNRVALKTFSYFDTGKQPSGLEPERFYHGFVLGLIVELNGRYVVTSNRESGFGRYDVMLEPVSEKDDAIIIEFKVRNTRKEKNLEETLKNALEQIEDKDYAVNLTAKGIPADCIRKYGFVFEGKNVLIGGGV